MIYIGTSGWSYDHWTHVLYPEGLPPARRLEYYLPHFHTVELNSSYYHWPRDTTFARWRDRLPADFRLSVKAPRLLTHIQRLYSPERWLARIQQGLTQLGPQRGVLLVQLPPQMAFDEARLAYFLAQLPPGLETALEFRHPSWHQERVFDLLAQHSVAYCVMSGAHLPCILRATSRIVYVRMHGPDPEHLYAGSYSHDNLTWWADRIREWVDMGHDVYVYFNNDAYGFAVQNALALKVLLGA